MRAQTTVVHAVPPPPASTPKTSARTKQAEPVPADAEKE